MTSKSLLGFVGAVVLLENNPPPNMSVISYLNITQNENNKAKKSTYKQIRRDCSLWITLPEFSQFNFAHKR